MQGLFEGHQADDSLTRMPQGHAPGCYLPTCDPRVPVRTLLCKLALI